MLKVFIRARHYDTTMNSARYAQARHLEIEKREMILEVLIPCRLDRRIGSGSSECCMVGARGFEPPTSCSQSRRATGLRYAPTY
jgi:hypothetical protein